MNPAGIAADLFRTEGSRIIAALPARFGTHRLQLAEDFVQEALVRALQTWLYRGVPENPAAWLTQTARNHALDPLRREQNWNKKQPGTAAESDCGSPRHRQQKLTKPSPTIRCV